MKAKKLFAILAIVSGVFIAGCQKDEFVEIVGECPIVVSTNPDQGATNVPINRIISASFNTRMNPATINQVSFTLHGPTQVEGVVTYADSTAFFTPASNLAPNTDYTARISTSVKEVRGNALQADYVWTFRTNATVAPPLVNLNTVAQFGIIAGVGISNNAGFSEIHDMDIGISPGVRSSITGFPPGLVLNGAMYASDDIAPLGIPAMLIQAKQDLTLAYQSAKTANSPAHITVAGDLGGTTLAPGIYRSTSTLLIQSGDLTLDAQGDADAVWIFQIASNFTTVGGAGGNVILSGGAQAKNVIWQVGSSATIGGFTSFKGNVLALTDITMNSGATAEGRMLASNGAVVLTSDNIITKPK